LYGRKNKKEPFKSLTSFSVASKELLDLFLRKALENYKEMGEFTLRLVFTREEVNIIVPKEETKRKKGK